MGDAGRAGSHLRFFVAEDAVGAWREAEEIFDTSVWRLRRGKGRHFVLGTAFEPAQPYWVAGFDIELKHFDIARLTPYQDIPVEQVVEAALRVLPRMVLMHRLLAPPTGMLVHAAGGVVAGRTHLFLGQSGAGKSTLSRLLLTHGGVEVVNDDRMLLTHGGGPDEWTAWGTPWPGELRIAHDRHAPLGALLFLDKSDRNTLEPLAPLDALERLIPLVSIPWYEVELVANALELCNRLVTEVPTYALRFRPDRGAVDAVAALASK